MDHSEYSQALDGMTASGIFHSDYKEYTAGEVTAMLHKAGRTGCPINTIDKIVGDPQMP